MPAARARRSVHRKSPLSLRLMEERRRVGEGGGGEGGDFKIKVEEKKKKRKQEREKMTHMVQSSVSLMESINNVTFLTSLLWEQLYYQSCVF